MSNSKTGFVKDVSGFDNSDLDVKRLTANEIITKDLEVKQDAVINCLSTNFIATSKLELNGTFESTENSVIDLNGNISINNQIYVLTVEDFKNALAQAAVTGGLSIFVAPGTFIIDSQCDIPSNTDIRGSGQNTTIFKCRDGFNDTSMFTIGSNSSLGDFQLDGNDTGASLLQINGVNNVNVSLLVFTNTDGNHIIIENCSNVDMSQTFFNTKTESGTNSFIYIGFGASDISFNDTNITSYSGRAIQISSGTLLSNTSADIENIRFNTLNMNHISSTTSLIDITISTTITCRSVSFDNCNIIGPGGSGLFIANTFNVFNIDGTGSTETNNILLNNINVSEMMFSTGDFFTFVDLSNLILNNIRHINTQTLFGVDFIVLNTVTKTILTNIDSTQTLNNSYDLNLINSSFISVSNCSFDGTRGILIDRITDMLINNIFIDNVSAAFAIEVNGTNGDSSDITFLNLNLDNQTSGINLDAKTNSISDIIFSNCRIGVSTIGIQIEEDVSNIIVHSCFFIGGQGVTMFGSISFSNIVFTSNRFVSDFISCISTQRAITGFYLTNNYFELSGSNGALDIQQEVNDVLIKGNRIISNTYGIRFNSSLGAPDITDLIITNNNINAPDGIYCPADLKNAIITDNILEGDDTGTGIDIDLTAVTLPTTFSGEYIIKGNHIKNYTTGFQIQVPSGSSRFAYTDFTHNRIVDFTNAVSIGLPTTTSRFSNIQDNTIRRTVTTTSSADYEDYIFCDTSFGAFTLTLNDLTIGSRGHKIYVEADTAPFNLIVAPTSPGNDLVGLANYTTSVTFNAAGEFAIFEWTGTEWDIRTNNGGVVV